MMNNSTNPELLKLAAQAMGCVDGDKDIESPHGVYLDCEENSPHFGMYYQVPDNGRCQWNPLENDGQLLELARICELAIDFKNRWVVSKSKGRRSVVVEWGRDSGKTEAIAILELVAMLELEKAKVKPRSFWDTLEPYP